MMNAADGNRCGTIEKCSTEGATSEPDKMLLNTSHHNFLTNCNKIVCGLLNLEF